MKEEMGIQLSKGQRIDLTKSNPGLTKAIIGLGWDVNNFDSGANFDLDASAFLADQNGKVINDLDFVFYNNLQDPSGSVSHTGDNRTGAGDGDDEQILVDFSKIPSHIYKIGITVTIHDANVRSQNFGQVSNAFVRVVNEETNEELLRYDLGEDFSIETAIVVCELYRHNGDWKFNAIGSGFSGGLAALCKNYGLEV
jgi:tellurium resistance protein TerD